MGGEGLPYPGLTPVTNKETRDTFKLGRGDCRRLLALNARTLAWPKSLRLISDLYTEAGCGRLGAAWFVAIELGQALSLEL